MNVLRRDGRSGQTLRMAAILLTTVALHCSSGGGGGGVIADGLTTGFQPSGTAAAPDMVRLAGTSGNETLAVGVVLNGPTSSSDLYSFAFDLVLGDSSVFELVSGSESHGDALVASGGQSIFVDATQSGSRITVGVTKSGGGAGNAVAAGEATVLTLTFRALVEGTSTLRMEASTGHPDPAALDSGGAVVGSVQFDGLPATLTAF